MWTAIIFGLLGLLSNCQSTVISSPQITNWGTWGPMVHCRHGTFAHSFQLKTEPDLGPNRDDTALNGIQIFCETPPSSGITSNVGPWGNWGRVYRCPHDGVLIGFELRSQPHQGKGYKGSRDDTAANNVKFYCSIGPGEVLEGDGTSWGYWTGRQNCPQGYGICGIQTQVERSQGGGDDTALNNVNFACCQRPVG